MSEGWWPRVRSGDLVGYLDDAEYTRLLGAAEPAVADAGAVILHKGSPSRSLLIVEQGALEVRDEALGEAVVLATIGPGEVVGEVGFVDGRARTHDVCARESCRLRRLTRQAFLKLVQDDPQLFAKLAVGLAELVAGRFRTTVAQLEPVRAFAASLEQPMELPEAAGGDDEYDEIDEPLPEHAVEMLRRLARSDDGGAVGL